MSLVVWIVSGVMAGVLASELSHHTGGGRALDGMLGVAGAIAGGLAINSLGFPQRIPYLVAGLTEPREGRPSC